MSKHGKSIISGRSCADGVDGVVENGALLSSRAEQSSRAPSHPSLLMPFITEGEKNVS